MRLRIFNIKVLKREKNWDKIFLGFLRLKAITTWAFEMQLRFLKGTNETFQRELKYRGWYFQLFFLTIGYENPFFIKPKLKILRSSSSRFFFLIAINLEAVLEGFSDCASLTSLIFTALWHVRDSRLSIQAIYYFIIVDDENLQLQFNNFQSFENWCVLEARSVMRFPLIELNLCYFFGIFDEIANLRQRSIAMFVFW